MALIKNSRPKSTSGGYERLFNNPELGYLLSRVQSAVISSGNELEKIITEKTNSISDIDGFLERHIMPDGVFVANKKGMKKCRSLDNSETTPDFVVFKRRQGQQQCHIIELKDGDAFDTKKSSGERQAMRKFVTLNAPNLQFKVSGHFCCFNQNSREEIVKGFKQKITSEEAMTGKEFCDLLELNYEEIVRERAAAVSENFSYFMSELIKIGEVKAWLEKNFPADKS